MGSTFWSDIPACRGGLCSRKDGGRNCFIIVLGTVCNLKFMGFFSGIFPFINFKPVINYKSKSVHKKEITAESTHLICSTVYNGH